MEVKEELIKYGATECNLTPKQIGFIISDVMWLIGVEKAYTNLRELIEKIWLYKCKHDIKECYGTSFWNVKKFLIFWNESTNEKNKG